MEVFHTDLFLRLGEGYGGAGIVSMYSIGLYCYQKMDNQRASAKPRMAAADLGTLSEQSPGFNQFLCIPCQLSCYMAEPPVIVNEDIILMLVL